MWTLSSAGRRWAAALSELKVQFNAQRRFTAAVKGEEITYLLFPYQILLSQPGDLNYHLPERYKNQAVVTLPTADGLRIDEVVWRDRKLVVWRKRSWLTQFLPQGSLKFYLLCTKQADLWQAYAGEAYITLTAVNISCKKGFWILPFRGATSDGSDNEDLTS